MKFKTKNDCYEFTHATDNNRGVITLHGRPCKDKEARRRARKAAPKTPRHQVIPDKRRKPPKHRKPIDDTNFGGY